jgi:cell division inhibitor SulA
MARHEDVKKWFRELSTEDQAIVDDAADKGTASAKRVRPMLEQAGLIEPTATDGQVLDTLKMRH